METDLQRLILRNNPWLSDPQSWTAAINRMLPEVFVPRAVSGRIQEALQTRNKAILVIGPRQSGKSTLAWQLFKVMKPRVLYLNCEETLIREWCTSPGLFLADLSELGRQFEVLFFDEIQHLGNAGLFFKGIVDARPGYTILATGSSAFELRSKTRESLAGRASRIAVFPFSLDEVTHEYAGSAPSVRDSQRRAAFDRHVAYGGYPDVWLAKNPDEFVMELIETLVMRDASDLFGIKKPQALRTMVKLCARQTGSLVNLSEWASICGIDAKTVSNYIFLLSQNHIMKALPVFAGGKRRELTSTPKIYFLDNGIRNGLAGGFEPLISRPDAGALLENWVFSELAKLCPASVQIHYWRTLSGAEVDFVLIHRERIIGIEVKASRLSKTTISRSARSFIEAYRPRSMAVVNLGLNTESNVDQCRVTWLEPQRLSNYLREFLSAS